MARDQNAFSLRQQVANQVADGMRLSCPWRTLHQNASVFLKLLGNANLLGIRRLAQQDFPICFHGIGRGLFHDSSVRSWRFLSNNVQKGPGQILSCAEIRENALDRGGESQSTRSQKENRF